ncbi:hypothetical protein F5Y18DRAFT_404871 [Xylariaceae sp. FL1019]|nr:hypothetical protein F5Y18DRAFT_404871 [Xylariaceae sp. FL1019]
MTAVPEYVGKQLVAFLPKDELDSGKHRIAWHAPKGNDEVCLRISWPALMLEKDCLIEELILNEDNAKEARIRFDGSISCKVEIECEGRGIMESTAKRHCRYTTIGVRCGDSFTFTHLSNTLGTDSTPQEGGHTPIRFEAGEYNFRAEFYHSLGYRASHYEGPCIEFPFKVYSARSSEAGLDCSICSSITGADDLDPRVKHYLQENPHDCKQRDEISIKWNGASYAFSFHKFHIALGATDVSQIKNCVISILPLFLGDGRIKYRLPDSSIMLFYNDIELRNSEDALSEYGVRSGSELTVHIKSREEEWSSGELLDS